MFLYVYGLYMAITPDPETIKHGTRRRCCLEYMPVFFPAFPACPANSIK